MNNKKQPIDLNDTKALRANRIAYNEARDHEWCQNYLHDNHPGILPLFDKIWSLTKGDREKFVNYADHFNSMTGAELMEELKDIK